MAEGKRVGGEGKDRSAEAIGVSGRIGGGVGSYKAGRRTQSMKSQSTDENLLLDLLHALKISNRRGGCLLLQCNDTAMTHCQRSADDRTKGSTLKYYKQVKYLTCFVTMASEDRLDHCTGAPLAFRSRDVDNR